MAIKTNPQIFKAYDIRGVFQQDLDEKTAYRLGQAYVALRRQDGLKGDLTVAVAGDMRLSTPQLKTALIDGLRQAGAQVVDFGLLSTPSFYFGVSYFSYDGGIIVSASHNPPAWNGFKLVREKARAVSGESGIDFLRAWVLAEENKLSAAEQKEPIINNQVLAQQVKHDLSFVDLAKIKPWRVVVDPANGMGAQYCEALFKHLPVELIKINFALDGTFPAHEADPLKEENLADLKKAIIAQQADLGIALDGDGDRVFFVDNQGETIQPAIIRGLLAQIFLRDKPGAKICYDIRPGRITRDLIEQAGGIPIVTRVGHSLIKEEALRQGAYFAGESSGHFFLNLDIGCFEMPMIMILKLLAEFSQSGQTVAEFIKPFKKYYHSGEINLTVKDKEAVFQRLAEKYHDGRLSWLDGISVEYPDFWFNVRASNTEPKIRLNLEAISPQIMAKKRDEVLAVIKTASG